MTAGQPFPFPIGVAFSERLYADVKSKIVAAERLRTDSQKTIDDLRNEIAAAEKAMRDQADVMEYDGIKYSELAIQLEQKNDALTTAERSLAEANYVIDRTKQALPSWIQRQATDPVSTANVLVREVKRARSRPPKWWLVGAAMGLFVGMLR